jgi:hypothetical protein
LTLKTALKVAPSTVGGTLDISHNLYFEVLNDRLPETTTYIKRTTHVFLYSLAF